MRLLSAIIAMIPVLGFSQGIQNNPNLDNSNHKQGKVNKNTFSVSVNVIEPKEKTVIAGTIKSAGILVFTNSKGFIFKKTAKIIAPGVIFSTLPLVSPNSEFDKLEFKGNKKSGEIINQGNFEISKGGFVAFIGSGLINKGGKINVNPVNLRADQVRCTGVSTRTLACKKLN